MHGAPSAAKDPRFPAQKAEPIGGPEFSGPKQKWLQAPHREDQRRGIASFGLDPVYIGALFARAIKGITGERNHSASLRKIGSH